MPSLHATGIVGQRVAGRASAWRVISHSSPPKLGGAGGGMAIGKAATMSGRAAATSLPSPFPKGRGQGWGLKEGKWSCNNVGPRLQPQLPSPAGEGSGEGLSEEVGTAPLCRPPRPQVILFATRMRTAQECRPYNRCQPPGRAAACHVISRESPSPGRGGVRGGVEQRIRATATRVGTVAKK